MQQPNIEIEKEKTKRIIELQKFYNEKDKDSTERSIKIEKLYNERRKNDSKAFLVNFAAWAIAIFSLILVWNALSRGSFDEAKDVFDTIVPIAAVLIGYWAGGREKVHNDPHHGKHE